MGLFLIRRLLNEQRRSILGPPALVWRDVSNLARIDIFTTVVMGSNIFEIFSTREKHTLENFEGLQSHWAARIATAMINLRVVVESRHISKSFNELV